MEPALYRIASNTFPDFSVMKAAEVLPVVEQYLTENGALLQTLLANTEEPTWDNFMAPLDEADDRFEKVWSIISHMHSVCCEDELRAVYEQAVVMVSDYYTKLGQNRTLFNKIEAIAASDAYGSYSKAQKKVIQNSLRDFRLSGVDLPEEKKDQLLALQQTLAQLTMKFEQNIMDATDHFSHHVTDKADLAGIPAPFVDAAALKAQSQGVSGWVFGLDAPTVFTLLSYAQNRTLREIIYRAYVSRASDAGPQGGSWDNSQIMAEILTVKQDIAHILGFSHYAALSLETKMARTVPTVMKFLADLAVKAKPQAKREYAELEAFAAKQDDIVMQPWDFAYYSEIAREARYHYNANAYRAYFPFDHVMQGLFTVVSKLFSLSIEAVEEVSVWHERVKLYAVYDQAHTLRGHFYIDLYAREKKRGGAWMDDYCARRLTQDGQTQLPIAFLTCNFSPPIGDQPALLLHDDVVTLFHEFGHTLHHLLTQVDYSGVSGISGVMWDAVELPSQFLEHWAYTPEGLAILGKHYETGEAIPQEMIDRLLAARHFQSAMQMMRQLEFAFFDMRIHSDTSLDTSEGVQAVLDQVRSECAVAAAIQENRFQHSFSHIFAGGYAAGYYSYKWAEVLSSDAFTRFETAGLFDKTEGTRFMQEILEQGGTDDADVLFHNLMGRAPQVDALLRHSGIEVVDGS